MASEQEEIAKVNTLPIQENQQNLILYSAAKYEPIELESKTIAQGIATGLCKELDFPRLVNQVYQDGAKIFIETGAGNVCSRWIDKNLSDKAHMTISLNRRGLDDHSSILKALAKLTSHQVSLNLSPLYSTVEETSNKAKISQKKVTLGGHNFAESILTSENKKLFQESEVSPKPIEKEYFPKPKPTAKPQSKIQITAASFEKPEANSNYMQKIAVPSLEKKSKSSKIPAKTTPYSASPTTKKLASTQSVTNYNKPQYQQFNTNNLMVHKTHSTFLKSRQDFSEQLSEIIELQIACVEHLFEN